MASDLSTDASGADTIAPLQELLYDSEQTQVMRVRVNGDSVICKERRGIGAVERMRHERRILERLAGVDGVVHLAPRPAPGNALFLQDVQGIALAEVDVEPGHIEMLAQQLAAIVADMHRAGVVHRDINPTNILLTGTQRQPILIDFDLATTFAEERPAFVHHREIAGTLAYLAPELTGRTGRSADQRADLYALGVTLYELAGGRLPFADDDPLQLIHDILASMPPPLRQLNPDIAPGFAAIVMRLLEKEPDRRYQSAEGLLHDLAQLRARSGAEFALGANDFPLRLAPPSQLVGRNAEIEELQAALARSMAEPVRGLLVTGGPGVGKTALINELRPMVTARRGWFVSGKFDQYRQAGAGGPLLQALLALSHLLLAEDEADLAVHRERILRTLGANAGLVTATDPQMAILLEVPPEIASGDPLEIAARKRAAMLDLLRGIAEPERPLVMVLDDLQWADTMTIGFIDTLLTDNNLRGLLLVGAYRENEIDAAHPLTAMLARWQKLRAVPAPLRLRNLPPADLSALLAQMLRMQPIAAEQLGAAIGARTDGNPYDTVELVNALRQDGTLVPEAGGWRWDEAAIRHYVGAGAIVDLLAARAARLPRMTQTLLETMACLGNEVQLNLLAAASDCSVETLEEQLLPPLDDGLLVLERGQGCVSFRHDRVQQAVYGRLDTGGRCALQLRMARRLAAAGFDDMAAALYLDSIADVRSEAERVQVIALLRAAAARARAQVQYAAEEHFLAAATALINAQNEADTPLRRALEREHHTALYSLGRLEEADVLYRAIEQHGNAPIELAAAACAQVSSLTNRAHPADAVQLGFAVLEQLGFGGCPADAVLHHGIVSQMEHFYRWAADLDQEADAQRPECTDARVLAAARLINRMIPPAFFWRPRLVSYLVLLAHQLWVERGPCGALLGPLSHTSFVTIPERGDHRTGYNVVRHMLAVAAVRGYASETPQALFLFALSTGHWFEPVEECVAHSQRACEALLHGGDIQNACFSYYASLPMLFDCASSLEIVISETDAGLAIAERTGNTYAGLSFLAYKQAARALRGETAVPHRIDEGKLSEAELGDMLRNNPSAAFSFHNASILLAILFGERADLIRHAAALIQLEPHIQATYGMSTVYVMQAQALIERLRTTAPDQRKVLLSELSRYRDWLQRRTAECPGNFQALTRWVDAELAWALGDFHGGAAAFDAALAAAERRTSPWQRGLITERAGLFYQANGLHRGGSLLLRAARRCYADWGATAKVQQMERTHAAVRADTERREHRRHSGLVSSETIDMLAILRASQALSSETHLGHLCTRVEEVLGSLTGATTVLLALRDDSGAWVLSQARGGDPALPIEQAGRLLPLSAFRYVQRHGEPLLVEDATQDDRFARDPYLAGMEHCSLLLVPILSHGALRAILLLENRLSRGAFLADRLDAVTLIAGQLAVSLDNAQLYTSLERKVAERTVALEEANRQLEQLSITDALTGLANRRRIAEVLEAEWQRALRAQTPIAAAMIDVDQFKAYNDHYGHQAGDNCLQQVAASLRQTPRNSSDLVARYGGEEFVVVLPQTDGNGARLVAERMRAAVAAQRLTHAKAPAGIVTISVGIAVLLPAAEDNAADLIAQADRALYTAKQNGRNRVEVL